MGALLASWPAERIAALSHGVAAAAFLALAAALLSHWRARRHAGALGAACALTVLWAAVAAAGGGAALPGAPLQVLPELLRSVAWLLLLLRLQGCGGLRLRAWLGLIALLSVWQLGAGQLPAWPAHPQALVQGAIGARLLLAVLGMLLVEQLYRNTDPRERWSIKFACLGIGALSAYDFYLYSDALLFRQINPEIWAARGVVDALTAPLLALAAARNPAWTTGLALSRQVILGSAALVGAAAYLLAMASSAYYLRYVGGAWGPLMQLASLFGAAMLLAGVLFSGAVRATLKVLISKHFYQGSYDYRQEWLRITRALAEDGPALAERSIQAVAALVESPAGALWLRRDGADFEPAAGWNMAPQTAREPADGALCRFLEARQWVLELPACRAEPGRHGRLELPAWLDAAPRFWLLVPMMLHGRLFGFVALAPPRTRIALDWEVSDVLKIAANQAASYLAYRESADSLAVARQFESFNRMSTFIVHDLKNLVAQLSLLLSNAEKHQGKPEFQRDMLATLGYSVDKMNLLLRKLRRSETQELPAPLALDRLLAQAVRARAGQEPQPTLEVAAPGLCVLANWARLERVLGHLIQNAVEATPRQGSVAVRLRRAGGSALIELSDTGQGMSEQFIRERLFKPFESTKAAGMGIGVFESREYIREVGGELEVVSEAGRGTTFRVLLPLHAQAAAAA
ncbi:PEP-CTERM system histidine kinase PrsK [Rugamonas sp. CCM 8940]|uniref:XrtA/PEP-CTERM system histidine kinase PrsK n=1 Tax=Rugamonas sp. CCM 8940 TaxID=2765359 RepID=UPI0018F4D53C|nr:XrtA/PEP-CTERM system histidine kinase PrsK [Rugamonas sp. CCM 8940]MBJ7310862.1 PEP-CTERM system histidine kinase PrsK [Rugamonas sp. CCM 8940]